MSQQLSLQFCQMTPIQAKCCKVAETVSVPSQDQLTPAIQMPVLNEWPNTSNAENMKVVIHGQQAMAPPPTDQEINFDLMDILNDLEDEKNPASSNYSNCN